MNKLYFLFLIIPFLLLIPVNASEDNTKISAYPNLPNAVKDNIWIDEFDRFTLNAPYYPMYGSPCAAINDWHMVTFNCEFKVLGITLRSLGAEDMENKTQVIYSTQQRLAKTGNFSIKLLDFTGEKYGVVLQTGKYYFMKNDVLTDSGLSYNVNKNRIEFNQVGKDTMTISIYEYVGGAPVSITYPVGNPRTFYVVYNSDVYVSLSAIKIEWR